MVHSASASFKAGLVAALTVTLLVVAVFYNDAEVSPFGFNALFNPPETERLTNAHAATTTQPTSPETKVDTSLPHISQCQTCSICQLTPPKQSTPTPPNTPSRPLSRRLLRHRHNRQFFANTRIPHLPHKAGGHWLTPPSTSTRSSQALSAFGPDPLVASSLASLPHCPECTGCTAQLSPLRGDKAITGNRSQADIGAAGESIFFANYTSPDSTAVERAVVKVWCAPSATRKLPELPPAFRNRSKEYVQQQQQQEQQPCAAAQPGAAMVGHLLAQQRVALDCGLHDINVKIWAAPLNAVDPYTHSHIWWTSLWMDVAGGSSAEKLVRSAPPAAQMAEFMNGKLNGSQVVRAAIYDLLTIQADRHPQNVFLDPSGNLKLIDNVQSWQYSWRAMSADSIFLPGTQKFEVLRLGASLVAKDRGGRLPQSHSPLLLLDYRCHVPGGRIAQSYPPEVGRCLRKISGMTTRQVMTHYHMPSLKTASLLRTRASDMLHKGFERTLQQGAPLQSPGKRYLWQPPCCRLAATPNGLLACGHPWAPTVAVPLGDPSFGNLWDRSYPDPGKFVGGTAFDPADLPAAMRRVPPPVRPKVVISVGDDEPDAGELTGSATAAAQP